jgi:choline dehydrogenase
VTRFDYVIVGAGPAGCVLANRLSADPRVRVLLIEAGDKDTNPLIPMVYNRGQRADYDALERLGNPGWGWDDMLPVFRRIEDHELGGSDVRGAGDPLLEDVIAAGTRLGWRQSPDLNESDNERIGYATATVRDGRRASAADAFLHPVIDRPNLTVALHTVVDQVLLARGRRAVGVRGRPGFEAFAAREVILAAGSIATPKILQLSGIGPIDTLRSAGVAIVADSPNVGARLREHRAFMLQFRLADDLGCDTRREPPAARPCDIVGFFKTRPEIDRPDAQIQIAAYSALALEREPGMLCFGFILRPDSEGSIHLTAADPDAPLDIETNYFATEHDRATGVDVFHAIRRLFATGPLAKRIEHETVPGHGVQADQEIIDGGLAMGTPGSHAIGTCAMGPNDDDVVDARLRVRGVTNLRVVDASVLPIMVSGNLKGPVTALAWRAADFIVNGA